jgi:guanine deaminase
MMEAVRLSEMGMEKGYGGPFGAVVVQNNQIIGRGWNQVITSNDPTAHAEVIAIRDACNKLGSFHLHGCEIFSSCEPCPMCLGAIYWAKLQTIYFANTQNDAAAIGFNDAFIYDELKCPGHLRAVRMVSCGREDALKIFNKWRLKGDKILY